MINVLRGYARSYVTNNGGLCKTADNGTHVVSLPTMLGNSFEVYRRLQGTNGVKGEKGVENCSLRFNLFSLMCPPLVGGPKSLISRRGVITNGIINNSVILREQRDRSIS